MWGRCITYIYIYIIVCERREIQQISHSNLATNLNSTADVEQSHTVGTLEEVFFIIIISIVIINLIITIFYSIP